MRARARRGNQLHRFSEHPANSGRDGLRQVLEASITALETMTVTGIHIEVMAANGKSHTATSIPAQLRHVLALLTIVKIVCHLIHAEDDVFH